MLLQNMPESRRSHVAPTGTRGFFFPRLQETPRDSKASVLFIWLAVAVACCVEAGLAVALDLLLIALRVFMPAYDHGILVFGIGIAILFSI